MPSMTISPTARQRRVETAIVLASWIVFAFTLALDARVAELAAPEYFHPIVATWIAACIVGLVGSILGLRGWPYWWQLCAAAAIVLLTSHLLYWYSTFVRGPDQPLSLAWDDLSRTTYHALRLGAFQVVYREFAMPLVQALLLAYFALTRICRLTPR
jgi:uncharacterized membrane protein YjjB (DUF3815 family)